VLQHRYMCFCGDSYGRLGELDRGLCNLACRDKQSEICGGDNAMDVYFGRHQLLNSEVLWLKLTFLSNAFIEIFTGLCFRVKTLNIMGKTLALARQEFYLVDHSSAFNLASSFPPFVSFSWCTLHSFLSLGPKIKLQHIYFRINYACISDERDQ